MEEPAGFGRREDLGAACAARFALTPTARGEVIVVGIDGDIDVDSVAGVERLLRAALARRPLHLVVDMADVTFCGVRGVRLLAATLPRQATQAGLGFTVTAVPAPTAVLMTRLFPASAPGRLPTAHDALVVIGSHLVATGCGAADVDRVHAVLHEQWW